MFSIDRNKIFSNLNTTAEIQDGVKIQNGAQKMKNLIFAAKWAIFNEFQKPFLCFVCATSVHKTPLRLMIKIQDGRSN
jgi:hypothetical protein